MGPHLRQPEGRSAAEVAVADWSTWKRTGRAASATLLRCCHRDHDRAGRSRSRRASETAATSSERVTIAGIARLDGYRCPYGIGFPLLFKRLELTACWPLARRCSTWAIGRQASMKSCAAKCRWSVSMRAAERPSFTRQRPVRYSRKPRCSPRSITATPSPRRAPPSAFTRRTRCSPSSVRIPMPLKRSWRYWRARS